MAISGFDGMYSLECDVCGADSGCDFDDFYEAVEYKKDHSNGWTSCKNQDGSWIDGWGEGITGPRAAFTIWLDKAKTQDYKIVSGSNKELICIIPSGKHSEGNEDSISALISAAPDMYKALEKAVEEYGKPGGPWNVPSEPGSWIALAKAALAKARGE